MKLFQNTSIIQKLHSIILITCGTALLLAMSAFTVYEFTTFKASEAREISGLSRIIGINSTASLEFNDRQAGREILDSLRVDPRIEIAALYSADGRLFASYKRGMSNSLTVPFKPLPDGVFIKNGYYNMFSPVMLGTERIGSLYIKTNLKTLKKHIQFYGIIMILVLAGSLVVAFLLASRLHKMISQPILNLAQTANKVTEQKNYSLRATKTSEDELGSLIDQFNEMLNQIQARDHAISEAKNELDQRVKERTEELEREVQVRQQTEEQLKLSARDLERSNQELQDFAFIASHDLQEPLRKIITYSTRISKKYEGRLDEMGKDYLVRMQKASIRMKRLLEDLLKLSRVSVRHNPFSEIDLDKVVMEVLEDLEIRIKGTNACIQTEPLGHIEADLSQIYMLFQNLIGNALKFHKPDTPPQIRIEGEVLDETTLEVRVRDNGIGFETKHVERIFKPFERLHGRSHFEGSGIGLSVCKKIIQRHSGMIEVDSAPGEGSSFIIRLPLKQNGASGENTA